MPSRIHQRLQSIRRFRQITLILAKYGFDEFLARIHLPLHLRGIFAKRLRQRVAGPERLVLALEELGPTFIKFGQILSTRSYLLSPDYAAALARLQDKVTPFPTSVAMEIIRDELGRDPHEVFAEFDEKPLASASIAQVYRSKLHSGKDVCVKVQRPNVRQTLELDIMILKELARLLDTYVPESRQYDPSGMVAEFERTTRREIDFTIEAANLEVFKENFRESNDIYIPEVYSDISTSRVLVTEYIEGIKISDVERLKQANLDVAAIARAGARAVFKQIYEDGLFHADPHPGNLFVLPDGRIAPVDFGIVGRLTRNEIEGLTDLTIAYMRRNPEKVMDVLDHLGLIPKDVDRRSATEDLMLFIDKYRHRKIGQINFKDVFEEFISFIRRYRIRIKTEFMLLGKALSIYEEVGRYLDPDFNILEEAGPLVRRIIRRKYGVARLLAGTSIGDTLSTLSSIPSDIAQIISLAKEGKLKIDFEHIGLEKVTSELERSSNRISFSLLVAALIVASSLILVLGGQQSTYHFFGLAGFGLAAVVGAWLLISIIRSGRV